MRQVIQGKVYDTETARLLFLWTNSRYPNDFRYREKALYRTPKGAFFLLHQGGPMTDMAVSVGGNDFSGSSRIEPISKGEALAFLESHGGTDVILTEFPADVEEA